MSWIRLAGALLVVCASGARAQQQGTAPAPEVRSFEHLALGTRVTLELVPGAATDSVPVAQAVFQRCDELELLTNAWSADSALNVWNTAAESVDVGGSWPVMPSELVPIVGSALEFAERTSGAFDPTVGAVLADLGFYSGTASREPIDFARVAHWLERVGHRRIELGPRAEAGAADVRCELRRPRLDLSAQIKGVAAGEARRILRAAGVQSARVAVGTSTICAWGSGPDAGGRGWPVALPGVEEDTTWWLMDETLSTSGRMAHTVEASGETYSHLIDPRTCRPVDHRTSMVAAVGPNPAEADMLSTALLVMGVEEGRRWIESQPEQRWTARFWSAPENDDRSKAPRPEIVTCGRGR